MFRWTLFFCTLALISAVFGYSGVSISISGVAQVLFHVFVALFVLMLVTGLVAG